MSQDGTTRKLAAVMVADVADYSQLMGRHELETYRQFQRHLEYLVRPLMSEHRGRVVKTTGDGFLAEFNSAIAAVICAVRIQKGMQSRNADLDDAERLQFRIGINVGDVIDDSKDLYGDEVNIAARLEKLADPGGIVVSKAVYRSARRQESLRFEDLGEKSLRNISEPVTVYRVAIETESGPWIEQEGPEDPSRADLHSTGAVTVRKTERPAIVVMPFINLSGDKEHEYFCDGLTNDLTTDLSKFKDLDVVAAQTALHFKNNPLTARQVSAELGVRYLLEGSVQRTGDDVRINAQLIDARKDRHVWAERFEKKFEDIFQLQDDLIQTIIVSLSINVDAAERERIRSKQPADMNAYDALLKGLHIWADHLAVDQTQETLMECRKWLNLAHELDPGYARPWSTLAYSYAWGWRQGWDSDDALELAGEYARKAVNLDPYNYDTHWDLAYCHLTKRDFEGALREYKTAHELNRNDVLLMAEIAEMYSNLGDHQTALEMVERAMRLNPYDPDYCIWTKAWILYFMRDYEGALEQIGSIRRPSHSDCLFEAVLHGQLAWNYRDQRQEASASEEQEKARASLQKYLAHRPDWTVEKELRACTFRRGEDEKHWRQGLERGGLPHNR